MAGRTRERFAGQEMGVTGLEWVTFMDEFGFTDEGTRPIKT